MTMEEDTELGTQGKTHSSVCPWPKKHALESREISVLPQVIKCL